MTESTASLLTSEEREALSLPYGARAGRSLAAPVSFPSVSQLDPGQLNSLCVALRRWVEPLGRDLNRMLRVPCEPRQPRHQTVARKLLPGQHEEPFWCQVEGFPGHFVLLTLPRSFAAAICERIFGAPFEERPERPLAPGEISLLRDLAHSWVVSLSRAWKQHAVRLCRPADVEEAAAAVSHVNWIKFTVELPCGGVEGSISLSLAPATAQLLLNQQAPEEAEHPLSAQALDRLAEVPVELRNVLGQAQLTLDELAGLKVGDVLTLDRGTSDLVDILIDDRMMFRARAGHAGRMVALEIVEAPLADQKIPL